jgi:hypothetical protein
MVPTVGQTGGSSSGSGPTTKCTAPESSRGQMAASIKVNTSMTENMGRASSLGRTGRNIADSGKTGSSMGRVCSLAKTELLERGSGSVADGLDGWFQTLLNNL